MKNIICLVSAFILSVHTCLLSQSADTLENHSSLEQEILAQDDTNLEIIIKSRNMILENLSLGNFEKINQLVEYLEQKFNDTEYLPLWIGEKIFLSYITRDYKYILDEVTRFPTDDENSSLKRAYPPKDELAAKLGEYLSNKYVMIKGEISISETNQEEKEFLILYLKSLLYRLGNTPFVSQEELNIDSDTFLRNYPESRYEDFVRRNIRYVIKISDWGLGIELGLGGVFNVGSLSSYFNSYPMFHLAMEGNYKECFLTFSAEGGSARTKKSFEYEGIWKDDLQLNFTTLEGNFGYNIFENEDFRIIPFAGAGAIKIAPPEDVKKELGNDVSLGYSTLYSVGINTDYKFSPRYFPSIFLGTEQGVYYIRLRAGYNYPTFNLDDERFRGGMLFFQIIFGSFGKKVSRDY